MTRLGIFAGRWRIVSMELWDSDAIDLVEPGFIEFRRDGTGRFGFVAVTGWMDCRQNTSDEEARVEFTWEGSDEGDQVSGRGWAAVAADGTLDGRIYFHLGDDSDFHAVHDEPGRRPSASNASSRN